MQEQPTNTTHKLVKVWDFPTRLFHVLLITTFIFLIISAKLGGSWTLWHMRAGYLMAGLLVFRLCWGIGGTYYSRFLNFLYSPLNVLRYLWQMITGKATHYIGHNPAGGLMVIFMITVLTVQVITGLVTSDDIFWSGPFHLHVPSELASLGGTIHRWMENILIGMVVLHIIAVLFHQFVLKEPLIKAMIHGKKPLPSNKPHKHISIRFRALFVAILLTATLMIWLWSLPN